MKFTKVTVIVILVHSILTDDKSRPMALSRPEFSERHGLKQALRLVPLTPATHRNVLPRGELLASAGAIPPFTSALRGPRESPSAGLFISGDAMEWIEAIINVTAFIGFIGIASIAKPQQTVDEIPASAQDSHVP
jgi:hypothetical protein